MFILIVVYMLIRLLINRLQRRRPSRIITIINWILIFAGIISTVLLFCRFFTTVTGSGRITGFINENPWTENDNLSKTTENVKSIHVKPLPNNGGRLARKMHPIEYLNQTTDELHLVSLAISTATPPPFRRGNNLSEFNFFTLAAVSPPLPQPLMQLTNNITICGCP
nr:uncharacterized protein LOC117280295 [Nicotiana tomentosiformis]